MSYLRWGFYVSRSWPRRARISNLPSIFFLHNRFIATNNKTVARNLFMVIFNYFVAHDGIDASQRTELHAGGAWN